MLNLLLKFRSLAKLRIKKYLISSVYIDKNTEKNIQLHVILSKLANKYTIYRPYKLKQLEYKKSFYL